MKKLMAGLIMCGLGLTVGCQGSASSGSTKKETTKTGTSSETKKEETKPPDAGKPADDKDKKPG